MARKIQPVIVIDPNAMPEWARTPEELALLEGITIEQAERAAEVGERPSPPLTNAFSTVQEVADRHRVGHKQIRTAIQSGSLRATNHGGAGRQARWRIAKADEEAWLAAKHSPAPARRPRAAKRSRTFRDKA